MSPKQYVKRQRALDAVEKDRKRLQILLAAEKLIDIESNRLPSVAEVAHAAGLAKGTVYLYFQSKEELLLSLHELHTERFFTALDALLDEPAVDIEAILDVTHRYILGVPTFMPLAGLCLGSFQSAISDAKQRDFHACVDQWLLGAGRKIELHFPALPAGEGAMLLMQSYGLMVGLWQLMQPDRSGQATDKPTKLHIYQRHFFDETSIALRALWAGRLILSTDQDKDHD